MGEVGYKKTEYLLDFSLRLNYLTEETHRRLQDLRNEVGKLLWKFYKPKLSDFIDQGILKKMQLPNKCHSLA
jgi:hypothetical protein